MKNNIMHEIDKKQLEMVIGGRITDIYGESTQEDRIDELKRRLEELKNTEQ